MLKVIETIYDTGYQNGSINTYYFNDFDVVHMSQHYDNNCKMTTKLTIRKSHTFDTEYQNSSLKIEYINDNSIETMVKLFNEIKYVYI